jgi:hypothetical protein
MRSDSGTSMKCKPSLSARRLSAPAHRDHPKHKDYDRDEYQHGDERLRRQSADEPE